MKSTYKTQAVRLRILMILSMAVLSLYANGSTRTCRVIMLDSPGDTVTDLYLFDGIDSTKIQYSRTNLSPIYELPHGDLKLALTSKMTATNDKLPDNAPRAEVDEDIVDVLLVLRSDPENPLISLEMIVVDIGDDKIKAGQTLWLNYTTKTISAELGGNTIVIDPDSQPISDAPLPESGFFKAVFSYRPLDTETFLPIMRKSWWLDKTSKNIGFIIDDKRSRLPRIFTLRDKR